MKPRAALILLLLAVAANAQERKAFSLPLHATPQGNAVYIEGKLNGKSVALIVDTGSTFSFCDVKICGKAPKGTASLELGSWHKDAEEIRTRDFAEVSKLAGVKVDGILGLLTMNQFRRVTFDFEHGKLELEP